MWEAAKALIVVDIEEDYAIVVRSGSLQWYGRVSPSTPQLVVGQDIEIKAAAPRRLGVDLHMHGRIVQIGASGDQTAECAPGLSFSVEVAWADRGVLAALNRASPVHCERQPGLKGDLADLPLRDIAQLLGNLGENARVMLRPDGGIAGGVYVERGLVVWAQQGEAAGDPALRSLLRVTQGTFFIRLAGASPAPARNVGRYAAMALFEDVRRRNATRSAILLESHEGGGRR